MFSFWVTGGSWPVWFQWGILMASKSIIWKLNGKFSPQCQRFLAKRYHLLHNETSSRFSFVFLFFLFGQTGIRLTPSCPVPRKICNRVSGSQKNEQWFNSVRR